LTKNISVTRVTESEVDAILQVYLFTHIIVVYHKYCVLY